VLAEQRTVLGHHADAVKLLLVSTCSQHDTSPADGLVTRLAGHRLGIGRKAQVLRVLSDIWLGGQLATQS
jgi:hypothetical protein